MKSINDMSFDSAFKKKRRELGPGKTFTWQGEKYTTDKKDDLMDDLTPRGNLPSPDDDVTEGGPTQRNSPRNLPKRKGIPLPSDRATGYRSQVRDTGMTADERSDAVGKFALGAASLLPVGRAVTGARAMKKTYDIGKNVQRMPLRKQQRAFIDAAREAREVDGMKSGGRVKKYASGGSVSSASKRADGCATKGKTKGRFV
jgi:hypothetical protein